MHILLTDDLYTNRIQIGIAIKSLGYTYDEANNGDQAIEKLQDNHYDLVLLDIEMPVRNGLETVEYIRNQMDEGKKHVPVIAITAHEPTDYFEDYKQFGFTGLITKPVTAEKIQKAFTK